MTRVRLICMVVILGGTTLYLLLIRSSSVSFPDTTIHPWPTIASPVILKAYRAVARNYSKFTFYKVPDQELFVFSAYHDPRYPGMVRLVGMAMRSQSFKLCCHIMREDQTIERVAGSVQYLPEGHNLKFDAVYVTCKSALPLTPRTSVGLLPDSCDSKSLSFLLPLQIIPKSPIQTGSGLSVCYPPLHSHFDDVNLFVENIELNRILGVRQFFVYVHKVGPRVRKAIESYAKDGVINVVSWEKFPLASGSQYPHPKDYTIHYMGQMVAINDCLYRAMNQPFRVVAFHDFDELIIPHKDRSLTELVAHQMSAGVSGLSVRCAMFSTLYPDDVRLAKNWTSDLPPLRTQLKTKRLSHILRHRERSKMLVVADEILTMGIHFVWHFVHDKVLHLPPKEVLLHHYRAWGNGPGVIDDTAWKYQAELLRNTKQRLRQLG